MFSAPIPAKSPAPAAGNDISQLFVQPAPQHEAGPGHSLTRAQILSLFSVQSDTDLIQEEAREADVFTDESLLPLTLSPESPQDQVLFGHRKLSRDKHREKFRRHGSQQEEDSENVNENIAILFGRPGAEHKGSVGSSTESAKRDLRIPGADIHDLFSPAAVPSKAVAVVPEPEKKLVDEKHNPFADWGKEAKEEDKVWYYKDLRGDIQGPFSAAEMNVWHKAGYFAKTLPVSCKDKVVFVSLETVVAGMRDVDESIGEKTKTKEHEGGNKAGMKIEVADLFGGAGVQSQPESKSLHEPEQKKDAPELKREQAKKEEPKEKSAAQSKLDALFA